MSPRAYIPQCARCYRPGVAIVYRRRTPLDVLLKRPPKHYRACFHHIPGHGPATARKGHR